MRAVVMVLAVLGVVGCTDNNPLPDVYGPLDKRVTFLEQSAGTGAGLVQEIADRKAADAQGLSAAKSYTADQVSAARAYVDTVLLTEAKSRMQGDSDTLAAATAYVDGKMKDLPAGPPGPTGPSGPVGPAGPKGDPGVSPAIYEPHLFEDNSNIDHGRVLWDGVVAGKEQGADVQIVVRPVAIYYDGANCTGNAYLIDPPSPRATTRWLGNGGQVFKPTFRWVKAFQAASRASYDPLYTAFSCTVDKSSGPAIPVSPAGYGVTPFVPGSGEVRMVKVN